MEELLKVWDVEHRQVGVCGQCGYKWFRRSHLLPKSCPNHGCRSKKFYMGVHLGI